jgi:hypothetical protein
MNFFISYGKLRIPYPGINQPSVIPVHAIVRKSIFELIRNVIDLFSTEGWFHSVGKIFLNSFLINPADRRRVLFVFTNVVDELTSKAFD